MRRPALVALGAAAVLVLAAAPAASDAAVTRTFENGRLVVTAPADEDVTLKCEFAGTQFTVNGAPLGNCNDVKSIRVNGGPGDTTVSFQGFSTAVNDEAALNGAIVIYGGGGTDTIWGSPLIEEFVAEGSGLQLVDAGPGKATLRQIEANQTDTLSQVDLVELRGTDGADYLESQAYSHGPVLVAAGAGNDTIEGGGGDELVDPGAGADVFNGRDGYDVLVDSALPAQTVLSPGAYTRDGATTTLTGVEGARLLDVAAAPKVNRVDASTWPGGLLVSGEGGDDEIHGGLGNNNIRGGDGNDLLFGGPLPDSLSGEGGNDEIRAIDGLADTLVDCGTEQDVLRGDAADIAAALSCESTTESVPGPVDPPKNDDPKPPPPPPPPPPLDTTAPALKLGKGALSKAGVYTIKVTCPAGEVSCTGTATLASVKKVGKKKLAFGTKSFTVAGGKSTTLKITLSAKHRKLLRQKRKIAAVTTFEVRDAAGNRGGASARVTLRAEK